MTTSPNRTWQRHVIITTQSIVIAMPLSLSVEGQNLRRTSPNQDRSLPPYASPISPETPDNIEKSEIPHMSYQGHEKPQMILSTQCVDDFTQNEDFQTLSQRDAVSREQFSSIHPFLSRMKRTTNAILLPNLLILSHRLIPSSSSNS